MLNFGWLTLEKVSFSLVIVLTLLTTMLKSLVLGQSMSLFEILSWPKSSSFSNIFSIIKKQFSSFSSTIFVFISQSKEHDNENK